MVGRGTAEEPPGGFCTFLYLCQAHRRRQNLRVFILESGPEIREIRLEPHASAELHEPDPLKSYRSFQCSAEMSMLKPEVKHIGYHLQRVDFQDM